MEILTCVYVCVCGCVFFPEMTGYGNTFTWVYTRYVPCFTMFEREFVAAAKDSTAALRQCADQHLFCSNKRGIQTFLKSGF